MIHSPLTRALIYLPAKIYELAVRARIALYQRGAFKTYRLNTPVIGVGNLTVGGTGKTPFVAFLANFLTREGHNVAILSRGYKRKSSGRIEVSNGKEILRGSPEAGDEPYLLAISCPGARVVVDANRYAAGRWLEERAPVTVFILDDAYQHLRLARDLNLILIDATEEVHEAAMVPLGRLREPLSELHRADAMIVTRSNQQFDRSALELAISHNSRKGTPIFYAHHVMTNLRRLENEETIQATAFAQKPIAAVSGIARPAGFIRDLSNLGMRVVLRRDFPDHHRYESRTFLEIVKLAREAGAEAIITTEKDAANLPDDLPARSAIPIYAAQIEFRCENEEALKNLVLSKILMNRS